MTVSATKYACTYTDKYSCAILQHEVMVTSGANQAFTNIVLTLVGPAYAPRFLQPRWRP